MASAMMEQAPGLAWSEIGRAAPEDECWVTWVAPGDDGSAFYRCLITRDGAAMVTLDLHHPDIPQPRRVHSGLRNLPPDDQASARCVSELLADADRAAHAAVAGPPEPGGPIHPSGPSGPPVIGPPNLSAPGPDSSRVAGRSRR